MKSTVTALLIVCCLAACDSHQTAPTPASELSQQDAHEGATLTSASAMARSGRITSPNTGHACRSGRLLTIKLIGRFPHTVTGGHPVPAGQPLPDFTVRAELITVDARSGRPCLIGVQTAENGPLHPLRDSTVLHVPVSSTSAVTFPSPATRDLDVGETALLRVFVHCGLRYAVIDGTLWETSPSGDGLAPLGQTDFVVGEATRTSQDTVRFEMSPDASVYWVFHPADPSGDDVCY